MRTKGTCEANDEGKVRRATRSTNDDDEHCRSMVGTTNKEKARSVAERPQGECRSTKEVRVKVRTPPKLKDAKGTSSMNEERTLRKGWGKSRQEQQAPKGR